MESDAKARLVREGVKWVTSAVATKIAFDNVVGPVISTVADATAEALFPSHTVVVPAERLTEVLRRQFADHSVLIIGPPRSGRSSLLRFVEQGHPSGGRERTARSPNAGFRGVVGEMRFTRAAFADALATVEPHAVVCTIDPRTQAATDGALREVCTWVLPALAVARVRPQALHILLNFADQWGDSSATVRKTTRSVEDAIAQRIGHDAALSELRIRASETQLSPERSAWPEVVCALDNLGADLS